MFRRMLFSFRENEKTTHRCLENISKLCIWQETWMLDTKSENFITKQYCVSFFTIIKCYYKKFTINNHISTSLSIINTNHLRNGLKFTVLLICFYLIAFFAIAIILSTNALWWILLHQLWRTISESYLCVLQHLRKWITYL